jgi:hypothetical protein
VTKPKSEQTEAQRAAVAERAAKRAQERAQLAAETKSKSAAARAARAADREGVIAEAERETIVAGAEVLDQLQHDHDVAGAVDALSVSTTMDEAEQLAAVLDTITGDTTFEIDRAYKAAWVTLTPTGERRPSADVTTKLQEAQRRAYERIVTSRPARRSSTSESKPKGEFPPLVMETLAAIEKLHEDGADKGGLSVKQIAESMDRYSGSVWHAVRKLVEARRVRPMPDNAKRFQLFPSCGDVTSDEAAA